MKMLKSKFLVATILVLMLVLPKKSRAEDWGFMAFIFGGTIGYQTGYYQGKYGNPYYNAIDVNGSLMYFNYGLNYQVNAGPKLFVGAGLGTFLQLQYGLFMDQQSAQLSSLIRLRAEYPIFYRISDNHNWMKHFKYSTVGLHSDIGFLGNYGWLVGISFCYSFWDVYLREAKR